MNDATPDPETRYSVVAMGASAGGLPAIQQILGALPADFPAPILIVQHLDPRHRSLISEILSRRTKLTVQEAREGDSLKPGHVYTAPPDRHLLVDPDRTITLARTELVHFVRPSIDLLFESVAAAYGAESIAVVLTGSGTDGANGLLAVDAVGGTVIVQESATAQFSGMPTAAEATGTADFVLPLEEIAEALEVLLRGPRDDD